MSRFYPLGVVSFFQPHFFRMVNAICALVLYSERSYLHIVFSSIFCSFDVCCAGTNMVGTIAGCNCQGFDSVKSHFSIISPRLDQTPLYRYLFLLLIASKNCECKFSYCKGLKSN